MDVLVIFAGGRALDRDSLALSHAATISLEPGVLEVVRGQAKLEGVSVNKPVGRELR